MARGRMLNNGLAKSKKFCAIKDDSTRLLYCMMVPFADRDGKLEGDPELILAACFPRDKWRDEKTIQAQLEQLAKVELIDLYRIDDEQYIKITKFAENQVGLRYDREPESTIPDPPEDGSGRVPAEVAEPETIRGEHPEGIRKNAGNVPEGIRKVSGLREEKRREVEDKIRLRHDSDESAAAVIEPKALSPMKDSTADLLQTLITAEHPPDTWAYGKERKALNELASRIKRLQPLTPAGSPEELSEWVIAQFVEMKRAGADKRIRGTPVVPSRVLQFFPEVTEALNQRYQELQAIESAEDVELYI